MLLKISSSINAAINHFQINLMQVKLLWVPRQIKLWLVPDSFSLILCLEEEIKKDLLVMVYKTAV